MPAWRCLSTGDAGGRGEGQVWDSVDLVDVKGETFETVLFLWQTLRNTT